ncbi:GntR family transcriptional regulator [Mesorhizobium sp. M7D.F.Ca.US.005.01.1.1]|jgi:GntR family transcriptional regulator|uniref:GntR family transcriptional regulator n=1 Tax=unclassified Mesorhizobium TaxID=325217 RepID=UPI000F74F9EE|nr:MULTISPECIES: GntR family transcriptional regulator [unclassified Mesorhizobium]AZO41928.1 GntR family transcriptional regulator [Mesorhizobium sp. M7D.F.Ca.US.005.01.1.1]RVA36367.1 UTRA domain-containing protein [Mesorhizobium sp. M7D.F.Ca.US.004.03.1.1]
MATVNLIGLVSREMEATASDVPLYRRLKSAIEAAIRSNALKAGAVLPGERVLAEALSISRVTVRKALALLEEEGQLNRRHGSKTEIGSRVEKSLSTLTSFSEDILARGLKPGCLWLSRQISRPSPAEMMALGIAGNANVVRMRRVRTADGAPIAVEVSAVPVRFLPSPEMVQDSLYEALDARGFLPQRAIQRMRSRGASLEDAKHLHCEAGAPLLMTERRCFLADGQIVEYCETRYKGDVYDFVFELQR